MNKESPKQSTAAQEFWDAFRACVEDNRVRPDHSGFYVKWAQSFVDFLPEKRLRDRSRQDIEGFLADLAQRSGMKDWQVKQAERALRILYETFLPNYSLDGARKTETGPEMKAPDVAITRKTGVFLDRVIPGEVERRFLSGF
jgi:hypothetical protein